MMEQLKILDNTKNHDKEIDELIKKYVDENSSYSINEEIDEVSKKIAELEYKRNQLIKLASEKSQQQAYDDLFNWKCLREEAEALIEDVEKSSENKKNLRIILHSKILFILFTST